MLEDLVATLPKSFGLKEWIEEGDPAGEPHTDPPNVSYFWKVPSLPRRSGPGARLYVVYDGTLIGYSIISHIIQTPQGVFVVRPGGVRARDEAVTIPDRIPGFQGYRYRWWPRDKERPFPEWKDLA